MWAPFPMILCSSGALVLNMEERERKSEKSDSEKEVAVPGTSPTSAPELGAESLREAAEDDAEKTNVCSEKFDPLLALYTPAVPLPFPGIKCFNNVAEYESFLKGGRGRGKPENVEKKRRKAMKGAADPERIERLKRLMVNNPVVTQPEDGESSTGSTGGSAPRRRKHKPQKNVLTRMPLSRGSPLGALYRCVEDRIRVRVYIRTFKGLRGVCSGFVVAFDKFWNMAMVDVDETYKEPLFGEEFYHEKALTVTRLLEKLKLQDSDGGAAAAAGEKPYGLEPQTPARSSCPHQPADGTKHGDTPACRQSHEAPSTTGSAKSGEWRACQKKSYGRVHTRHIKQLLIRGESVILVNPQAL